jgi:hypothetical protein
MVTTGQSPATGSIADFDARAVDGLPPDVVRLLQKTTAHVGRMARSIAIADIQLETSIQAVLESEFLLARLRRDGF